MSSQALRLSAADELRAYLQPDQLLEAGADYEEARRIWNGAVDRRPALILRCRTASDVQAAVLAARQHELPLSVRGGGHDWAGRALAGAMVIDLSGMRRVTVDAGERIATLGGGATAGDLVAAAGPHGLAAAIGTVGSVGMAGLTLGGGYGPLGGRFGLALDNLVGADIVLADGRLVTADAQREPELFWALRGGGGNFGVVTSMRVRLHPLDRLIGGIILFPLAQAAAVMGRLGAFIGDAPDELTVMSGILCGPAGDPALFLAPTWSGEPSRGERAMAALQRLGTPAMAQIAPMTQGELLGLFDSYVVKGRHYGMRTRTVASLTPDAIVALVEGGTMMTSPHCAIAIHHFHGMAARVPLDSTAFGIRRDHFMIEIVPAWYPEEGDATRHLRWADSLSAALAPGALPGGYANLLAAGDHQQIAAAYGPNAARLRAAKTRFDPDGIFSAIPLPFGAEHGARQQAV